MHASLKGGHLVPGKSLLRRRPAATQRYTDSFLTQVTSRAREWRKQHAGVALKSGHAVSDDAQGHERNGEKKDGVGRSLMTWSQPAHEFHVAYMKK